MENVMKGIAYKETPALDLFLNLIICKLVGA